ncbi:xylose ABC transporter ATP-binding protein [Roseospira visakhapatnamensis]|uniref:D-xylose transport system ATP-binding protein n=1 Tax=Roseospira visakhapatnamensis TaxID=390880 RepID=A0A7W6RGM6_9PROT|nr:xylose ABC transporter ATP-binding protein [Roseospira visakhapatnamensis]MBB4267957.1 D-xylose transport system ATP-binding protein [Roseospira visakhapatnamensis]
MSDYLLEMKTIVKEFSGVKALDGIDLKVRPGEVVGLCGENGAGKSTLMKVLSAVHPHGTWSGEIIWEGQPLEARTIRRTERAGIVIVHQELMLVPELSVAENIFLGREVASRGGVLDYEAMNAKASRLMADLKMSHVNVALPVSHYSGGILQLIEIAKALGKNAKLLILDEPTSALSQSETRTLLDLVRGLKDRNIACVYISHKLEEIEAICDTVAVIRDGQFIGQAPMAALTVDKIIHMMVGRELKEKYPREPHAIGEVVFDVRHVTCHDPINPDKKKVDDVSFTVRAGEILGIAGLVGAGRTEMASALFGHYKGPHSVDIHLDGRRIEVKTPQDAVSHGICMVPEDRKRHGIVPLLGIGQNITLAVLPRFARFGLIDEAAEFSVIGHEIDAMSIKTASPLLAITSLSGGNQQKAVVAKMLLPKPRVLILDEPTRGVDVGAKYEIYKLIYGLAKDGIAIVMMSSELPEVLGISDRVLVIGDGEVRGDFVNDGTLTQEKILTAALTKRRQAA